MRHAKSDWQVDAGSDFQRPLNKRGIHDAPIMGRWLVGQGLMPEKIVSSPALRARQTILAVAKELGFAGDRIIWNEEIYEASMHDLLNVIKQEAPGCNRLMLVGHNPALDALAFYLSKMTQNYMESGKLITTAAIAVFEIPGTEINEHCAGLSAFIRPRELKK